MLAAYEEAVERLRTDIIAKEADITELYDLATSTGSKMNGERVQGGGGKDKIPEIVARIDEKKREVAAAKNKLVLLRDTMDAYICTVHNAKERCVLSMRLISNKRHSEIAEVIDISDRQEYRIYKSARKHLEDNSGTVEGERLRSLLA